MFPKDHLKDLEEPIDKRQFSAPVNMTRARIGALPAPMDGIYILVRRLVESHISKKNSLHSYTTWPYSVST